MTGLARQRSRRSAAFAKTSREFVILRSRTCSFNGASGPMSCSEKQVGEEAATPRQPVALARVFWSVPRQFTLENRRLPLALPQSFGKLRNYPRFAEPTFSQFVAPRNTKKLSHCAEAVDDETSLWKPEEN